MSFHLEIPDDVVESLHLPREEAERELRTDLALVLYARGALSTGKAAQMCQLSRWSFEDLLAQRKIERPFAEADWEHDRLWSNHRSPVEAASSAGSVPVPANSPRSNHGGPVEASKDP